MEQKRFAIILAGAGVKDGSELHETVNLLTALSRAGAAYQCYAPDMEQHDVVDHLTGESMPERRSVLREAARIARGNIKPLSEYRANDYSGLFIPGGFGAAKNLCTYAFAGENFTVNADVERAILDTHAQRKPIGALCIAPIILAKLLKGVRITLGPAGGASDDAARLGAAVQPTGSSEVMVDEGNCVFTTPCYMHDAPLALVADGIYKLVDAVMSHVK